MVTEVKVLLKKKLSNPVLFTGLPGIGLVGKLSVDYLLKHLKTERFAEVYSDSFPPAVHTHKGVVALIKDDIYYCKIKKQDVLFLAGPVQPSLDMRYSQSSEHYEFAEQLVLFCKKQGVKRVYTLAGINIGEARISRKPRVIVAATQKKIADEFVRIGCVPSEQDGLVSGAAGLMLGIGHVHGIEGACLMGETNANLVYGDHGAAKTLLEVLGKKFGFSVEMKSIEKDSKNIETAFTQLSQDIEAQQKELSEDPPGPGGLTYVR